MQLKATELGLDLAGPVILGIHVDYRDNHKLFEMVNEDGIH